MKKLFVLLIMLFIFCPSAVASLQSQNMYVNCQNSYCQQTVNSSKHHLAINQSTTLSVSLETLNSNEELIQDLEEIVSSQLEDLDFSSLDQLLQSFSNGQISIFGGQSFLEKVVALISGEYDDSTSIWQALLDCFLSSVLGLLPMISLIIGISILGSMLQAIRPTTNGKSMSNIINFVSYSIVVVLLLSLVSRLLVSTTNTILSIKSQMDAIFPILLTLLTAMGGTVSASIYQPAMAVLSNIIGSIATYVLLPLFIFIVIFTIVSNLSSTVKLDKFSSFLSSSYKWITGLVFTVFTAFISLQGISAGSVDGISIRTAKFAIKSYIPLVGSYISDGMGIILASSNLIKNAVGVAGLFLLLASILSPLLDLIICVLALKLIAGIIEPLGNKQIASFASSLSKCMVLLISLIVALAFVYFILLGLVMCSANIF